MRERMAFGVVPSFWVTIARRTHPFPSRTRQLSPSAPMVLHAQVCGRVGRRPIKYNKRPGHTIGPFAFQVHSKPNGVPFSRHPRCRDSTADARTKAKLEEQALGQDRCLDHLYGVDTKLNVNLRSAICCIRPSLSVRALINCDGNTDTDLNIL